VEEVAAVLVDLGAVPTGQHVALVVAQDPEPPPGKGPEFGKASPVGLVVVVLLFLAMIVLIRSMNKHLRRVPASFDEPAATSPDTARSTDAGAQAEVGSGPRPGDAPTDEPTRD
jgi:hypothetical protein